MDRDPAAGPAGTTALPTRSASPEPRRGPGAPRARAGRRRIRAPLVAALALALGAGAACDRGETPAPAPPTVPGEAGELPSGTELVALYFGATTCRPCLRPEVKDAIRQMRRRLEERARATGRHFASVGVALDWSVPAGVEFLAGTAEFDEIAVGRNWANAAAIQHLWRDPEAMPAIPQVVVLEREVGRGAGGGLSFGESRVVRRVLGASTILAWVEEGTPLDDGS